MSASPAIERLRRLLRAASGQVAFALALSQISACALIAGSRPAAAPAARVPTASTAAMLAALATRDRALHSMQTGAIMQYSAADGHHFSTHEQIDVVRPASIRVEALSPFGAAMVLAADDAGQLMIFDPSHNTLLSGEANAATFERYVRIPMAPASAVDLLMGLAPDANQLNMPPDSVSTEDAMSVLGWRLGDGGVRELGFENGELAIVRERDAAGVQRYEVRYTDWRAESAISFPHKIEAQFPSSRVTLRYETPVLNASIPASLFVLTPGPSTRQISIDAGGGAAPGSSG
jgi:hypothetical protein